MTEDTIKYAELEKNVLVLQYFAICCIGINCCINTNFTFIVAVSIHSPPTEFIQKVSPCG